MEEKKFVIKRDLSDAHKRELIINENFLKFEEKNSVNPFTIFQASEITNYRLEFNEPGL